MSRIWTLARKDLLETRRDRLSAIFIIIMPIAFTAFFGLMFGSGSDRLALGLHDADRGIIKRNRVCAPRKPLRHAYNIQACLASSRENLDFNN